MKNLKNNKGFSLVELIIVIAIMAVLIGVLAPQYLKYVEKSRVSADGDTVSQIQKAVETIVSDPDNTTVDGNFDVTINATGTTVTGTDATDAATELGKVMSGYATQKLKSKTYLANTQVTISVTWTTDASGVSLPSVTVTGVPSGSTGTTPTP